MSQSVIVAVATTIAEPCLREWLRAPVKPASAWTQSGWAGLCASWSDGGTRRRYRAELPAAVEECDRWIDGDHAAVLRGLDEEDALTLGFDGASGSFTVDFDSRADFRLPTLVWAFTVVRGMADFMADDDRGLVTVTVDWSGDTTLMHLAPNRSSFLDRGQDSGLLAGARDAEFGIRCAAGDADTGETATEMIERLLGR
jgi:hypothetical protein